MNGAFLVALFLANSEKAPPTLPTGREVLAALQVRSDSIENVMVRSVWETLRDGRPVAWEEQERYMDNLGRVRLKFKHGAIGEDGAREQDPQQPSSFDILDDGEKRIDQTWYNGRDRFGAPLPNLNTTGTYRAAQVFEGRGPGGADSLRNPLTYGIDSVQSALREAVRANRDVTIHAAGENVIQITVSLPPTGRLNGIFEIVGLLDYPNLKPGSSWKN